MAGQAVEHIIALKEYSSYGRHIWRTEQTILKNLSRTSKIC
jgi:hypothetical protein